MADLFDPTINLDLTNIDPDKDYLEELVGEGKKFSDTKSLALAKMKSDEFIEQLKLEQAGLRKELNTRVKMEEFIDKLNSIQTQVKPPISNEQDALGANGEGRNQGLTQEDITKLLDNRLTERERISKASQNVELVKQKLQESLGPNYATKLEQLTNSLGLSKEYLNSIASASPSAFLKLVGVDDKKQEDVFTPPPKSQFNSEPRSTYTPGNRNYKFYENMYNSDPNLYWSAKVQNELTADRKKLGAQFFKL